MDENPLAIEMFHVNGIDFWAEIFLAFELGRLPKICTESKRAREMHIHETIQVTFSLHELLCAVSMIVAHLYLAKGYK